jgi:hypothetical protein
LNSTTKCELEALQFLEDQRKELVMLNCYPISKRMFVHFNAALPSSAPVERSFSFAGIITRYATNGGVTMSSTHKIIRWQDFELKISLKQTRN